MLVVSLLLGYTGRHRAKRSVSARFEAALQYVRYSLASWLGDVFYHLGMPIAAGVAYEESIAALNRIHDLRDGGEHDDNGERIPGGDDQ